MVAGAIACSRCYEEAAERRNKLLNLRASEAVKAARHRETVREIGKENVAELMRKRGVDDPEDLE